MTTIESLGFTPSTVARDLFNFNTEQLKLCVLVEEERITCVSFNVDKDGQPEYEYIGDSFCRLRINECVKDRLIDAIAEVSKGNNVPWVEMMNPMTNPFLHLK